MTHHIPEKRRTPCFHFHRARIHSWQNAAVLPRAQMSRRSKRAAVSWLIFSYICAVSEVGPTNSMRLKSYSKGTVPGWRREASQYASATAQISGNAVVGPVSARASRAFIWPYSRVYPEQCRAPRVWVWRTPVWHLPVQAGRARRQEGGSGMRPQPSGVVVVWK